MEAKHVVVIPIRCATKYVHAPFVHNSTELHMISLNTSVARNVTCENVSREENRIQQIGTTFCFLHGVSIELI